MDARDFVFSRTTIHPVGSCLRWMTRFCLSTLFVQHVSREDDSDVGGSPELGNGPQMYLR